MEIDYYTDILCVWAWITQKRVDELISKLGDKIKINYHFVDIFGDVDGKINSKWIEKGSYEGFSKHVLESANQFNSVQVNRNIWTKTRPRSSANAHLYVKAVLLAMSELASVEFSLNVRKEFFIKSNDISNFDILDKVATKQGLDVAQIKDKIFNGSAMAALMSDYQKVKLQGIKGSPSFVLDSGRQVLYGNVGYRVLVANVEELLSPPSDEASWC